MRPQNVVISIRVSPEKRDAVKGVLKKSGMPLASFLKLSMQRLIEDGDESFVYKRNNPDGKLE